MMIFCVSVILNFHRGLAPNRLAENYPRKMLPMSLPPLRARKKLGTLYGLAGVRLSGEKIIG